MLIANSIFFSIIKYANKTNEIFESIVFTNEFLNEKSIMNLMIITSAIIQKFKNFFSIKTKAFKKEKYLIDPITKLQRYYGLFKINIKEKRFVIVFKISNERIKVIKVGFHCYIFIGI